MFSNFFNFNLAKQIFKRAVFLWQLCLGKAQFFFCLWKFYEINPRAKVRLLWFGFPQETNEISFSSETWKMAIPFFSFLNYHLNIHGFFIFLCGINFTLTTSVLGVVICFFVCVWKKLQPYSSITSNVNGFKMQKLQGSLLLFSGSPFLDSDNF